MDKRKDLSRCCANCIHYKYKQRNIDDIHVGWCTYHYNKQGEWSHIIGSEYYTTDCIDFINVKDKK